MTKAARTIAKAAAILKTAARLEAAGEKTAASTLRRTRTERDPALFALVYLSHHLADAETGRVSLSPVHLAWAKSARSWRKPLGGPTEDRRAEVAPREMGKSTWHFLILALWAAAFGYRRFIAAFADSDSQAETHLATFKRELETNPLLRRDFPDLCAPRRRERGTVDADRVSLYHARSGFVFAARGMDSSNLGMKVGDARPDLLILDDIEPHEGRYSAGQAEKRLATLRQAILPLNVRATVILVGTVTMHGSIVHQVVRHGRGDVDEHGDLAWVGEERIVARHFRPFTTGPSGEPQSVWPEKWPTEWLLSIRQTRAFALNYENDPTGADGGYWTREDFRRARAADLGITRRLVTVDPAVTSKGKSDYTALAVTGYVPARRLPDGRVVESRVVVLHAEAGKLRPSEIRGRVLALVSDFAAGGVLVEVNQGGDLWTESVLTGLPVPVRTEHVTDAKETRAAWALDLYQAGRVDHDADADLSAAEGQMVAFPKAPHDDMVDAVGAGVRYFLRRRKKKRAGVSQASYAR